MASKKNRSSRGPKEAPRRFKKKTSVLTIEKVEYVDYKDVDLLTRFISDRAKIRNRRVTGNDVQQQRDVANAIKVAREMALIPYAKRVSSQRTRPSRDGDSRFDRGGGDDRREGGREGGRGERRDSEEPTEVAPDAAGGDVETQEDEA